ncbi:MAG: F0F1 ATP synthase subunit B [Oscillospiraceae bacterium]|nr:F0F1 ATP synthase subunit B [Oscillospiraceae bacterium]
MGPGEFLNINFFTSLFTLVNTVALFLVLKKFLFKPVMQMITDRQKEIDDMYDAAGAAEKNAKALEQAYQQKLSVAAETGERMVKDALKRGQDREEEIIRQANAQAAAILDKAATDIAMEKKKAVNDAKDEISEMALAIAEKVVGRELTVADQAGLVDAFIKELGEQA